MTLYMVFISMGARNEQNNHIDMANEYVQINEYKKKNPFNGTFLYQFHSFYLILWFHSFN